MFNKLELLVLLLLFLLIQHAGSLGKSLAEMVANKSGEYVYMLRGRDGVQGRDGRQGRDGPQGRDGTPVGPRGEHGPIGVQGPHGPSGGGATYIRWGNSSCPEVSSTTIVYTGIAGGSNKGRSGGGANYLCMPKVPGYNSNLTYRAGVQNYSPIDGAMYENPMQGGDYHSAPCALCYVSARSVHIMIPAMASCPSSWTREYFGYLMSEYRGYQLSSFVCVDESMESISGKPSNTNGASFFHSEATCGPGLPCSGTAYNNHQELNCVVCTK